MENVIVIAAAFVSTFGFSLMFNQSRRHWFFAALSGAVCWGVFLLCSEFIGGIFLSTMIAGAATVVYSEIMARVKKTPANQFLMIGLIPLVPGGSLYYCMSYAIQNDWETAQIYGRETGQYALGIAVGISLTWALMEMGRRMIQHRKENKKAVS